VVGEVIKFPRVPRAVRTDKTRDTNQRDKRADHADAKSRGEGDTLCRAGFHKWVVDQKKQFDVKLGKLVTVRRCTRCGARKTSLD
jgi:hypothetical protein